MIKHFDVCASPFSNGVCEVTVERTFFNIPILIVSIEGYIVPNDTNEESTKRYSAIIADAYRKAHLLNLIANRKLPRRKKHTS